MKNWSLVFAIVVLQGCAFSQSVLEVEHSAEANFRGPISAVDGFEILRPVLSDQRADRNRIGAKKNGYGMETADISSSKPVEDILASAIVAGFQANGHSLGETNAISVTGDVKRFWFDTDVNFWTVEFTGEVQCSLKFFSHGGDLIHQGNYTGAHSIKKGGGLEKTWTEVMSKAVDNLVEDIMFDEDLVEAMQQL